MHPTILHYQKGNILNTRPEAASRNKQDQEILEMIPKNSQRMISPNLAIFSIPLQGQRKEIYTLFLVVNNHISPESQSTFGHDNE